MFVTFAKPFSSFKTEGLEKRNIGPSLHGRNTSQEFGVPLNLMRQASRKLTVVRKDGKGYEKSNKEKHV